MIFREEFSNHEWTTYPNNYVAELLEKQDVLQQIIFGFGNEKAMRKQWESNEKAMRKQIDVVW